MSPKLLELETSNLTHGFVWAMPAIFGSMVGYPSDSLASCSQESGLSWRCLDRIQIHTVYTPYTAREMLVVTFCLSER